MIWDLLTVVPLAEGELDGMREARIARPALRTRLLTLAAWLLLPGVFLLAWLSTFVSAHVYLHHLPWILACFAVGTVAAVFAIRGDVFCRQCARRLDTRCHCEMRGDDEYRGTVLVCRHCKAYQKRMTRAD